MKNKYLVKIKGLTQDEQTKFISSNLKDNIHRLKVVMQILLFFEIIILSLILIPKLRVVTEEMKQLYIILYIIVICFTLLFIGVLYIMGRLHNEKTITSFRIIILTSLMLLLFWGVSMRLLGNDNFLQPNIYILILLFVSAIPFFNYWEILAVTLPSQFFLTIFILINQTQGKQEIMQILLDTWGFVLLAIVIASLLYTDRVQYFKKDLQLIKQNNILKLHSEIDALTDVYNRRKLDETIEIEWRRSSRTKKPVSFLLIDLDHFKKYNDSQGHIEGDLCLRKSAAIMKNTLKRSSDMIFRYGGEEFGIILPFTDINAAELIAEKLRKNIETAGIMHPQTETGFLTISVGLTSSIGTKENNCQSMYIEADKALYAAKRSGRNKIIAFEK